jgi:hypothetical protein
MKDSPSLEIGNTHDFAEVRAQVHRLVQAIRPGHEMEHIDQAFALIESGCLGILAGYSSLLTPYHNTGHVLEVVLCSARLLHGLHLGGQPLDALTIDACIVGALLHDSGYLMKTDETAGTGAQFTLTHVVRGVVFAEEQMGSFLSPELLRATGKVILTTDHRPVAIMPAYDDRSQQLAAWVTATADLVGQMANREYLERLLLLYFEFHEAGIDYFSDVHDLLEKTDGFYQLMAARLQNELGGLAPHLTRHFDQSRGVRRNFYVESVDRNLDYLSTLVKQERAARFDHLKRGGIVEQAIHLLDKSD